MTNKWTAARLSDARARCDAAPAGPLTASVGNIWPDPDMRPRESQVNPVAVCYGPHGDAYALAEFFAVARDDLPDAIAWTEEVCAALGCAPEDAGEKAREMVSRLAAWTAPVDVQRTVEDIVTAVYLKPPMSAHDVGEHARPHVEKAAQLRRELTEREAHVARLTCALRELKAAHDATIAKMMGGAWGSNGGSAVRAHTDRLRAAVQCAKSASKSEVGVDAPYPDVETLLTEEEKREAWWLGKTTGIGFTAGKQAIADVKIRRMGPPVADLDRMLRVSAEEQLTNETAAAMTGPAVSAKEAESWAASKNGHLLRLVVGCDYDFVGIMSPSLGAVGDVWSGTAFDAVGDDYPCLGQFNGSRIEVERAIDGALRANGWALRGAVAGNPPSRGPVSTAPHSSALGDDGCGCEACKSQPGVGL